jgi:hypothetical protein
MGVARSSKTLVFYHNPEDLNLNSRIVVGWVGGWIDGWMDVRGTNDCFIEVQLIHNPCNV